MHEKMSSTHQKEQENKTILSCSLIIFILLMVNPAHASNKTKTLISKSTSTTSSTSNTISSACANTLYPSACLTALASIAKAPSSDPFTVSVEYAKSKAQSARSTAYSLSILSTQMSIKNSDNPTGVEDCLELLDATLEHLNDVISSKSSNNHHDINTWLSAALTYQTTCTESLKQVKPKHHKDSSYLTSQIQNLSEFISNSLALYKHFKDTSDIKEKNRKLLSEDNKYPAWLSAGDRKLLEMSVDEIEPDAVVAMDGSGTHRSIDEAIVFVALEKKKSGGSGGGGGGRSVIYVKAGTYKGPVNIPTKQKNVMLMGDGKGVSVIVGSKSYGGGYTTYNTATVAAMGAGFIAKDLTIINNAGPSKGQAVALRVGADKSVICQCSIQGYQDTLYTLSNRQFYTSTDIYGTIDFIFGNSAVVLQNCFIQPIKPAGGQTNSVTAQGRSDPNQNTGISIHKCKIQGSSNLGGTPTYLGRPWQKYSRVVVMESSLDGSISKKGWDQWDGSFALSTLYYGEYGNTGAGAGTGGRVTWLGVHPDMSSSEAEKFTVGNFIFGDYWLPETGVGYTSGL